MQSLVDIIHVQLVITSYFYAVVSFLVENASLTLHNLLIASHLLFSYLKFANICITLTVFPAQKQEE